MIKTVTLAAMPILLCLGAEAAETADRLPSVLVIGDSISIYYTPFLKKELAGKAVVKHSGHAADTSKGIERIDGYLSKAKGYGGKWDVIHFNWGLHDLKKKGTQVPVDKYAANLRVLVRRMKKTGARLIWATITPVGPGAARRVEDIARYNAAALKVMKEEGVEVNDLHAIAAPRREEIQKDDNVHFKDEGSKLFAKAVAKKVLAALKRR